MKMHSSEESFDGNFPVIAEQIGRYAASLNEDITCGNGILSYFFKIWNECFLILSNYRASQGFTDNAETTPGH